MSFDFEILYKMACLLTIETSTKACSLAMSQDGKLIFNRKETQANSHASLIGIYAWEAMQFVRKQDLRVDAIAVSAGPGSYTGLRIGVSEAKGLCYGLGIPLLAIPSLQVILSEMLRMATPCAFSDNTLFCPMIDARRMEVYAALYDRNFTEKRPVQADIIDENSYKSYMEKSPVVFMGDGMDKCKDVLKSPNALFVNGIQPTAEAMIPLAEHAYRKKEWVDVAYFEPFYLKEFQATIAKNKVLGDVSSLFFRKNE